MAREDVEWRDSAEPGRFALKMPNARCGGKVFRSKIRLGASVWWSSGARIDSIEAWSTSLSWLPWTSEALAASRRALQY